MFKNEIHFTNHAVKQMFSRNINIDEVKNVINKGEIVINYPTDKPYPSRLVVAILNNRPLHVVYSYNKNSNTIIVVTAYEPSLELWENNYKTRKK